MRSPDVGTAQEQRRPDAPYAILHVRRFGPRVSAVIAGPFEEEREALKTAARLAPTATPGTRIDMLQDTGAWLACNRTERTERSNELIGRLLQRLRKWPNDFDPTALAARRPPGALFALAAIEAPRAARRIADTLGRRLGRQAQPSNALVGQILLDVPHDRALLLHRTRWPAHWFPGRDRPSGALRPANARTACAVLARRLRHGRWPGPKRDRNATGREPTRTRERPTHTP